MPARVRRQRHRGRIVEEDVKVDVGRHLRACLRNALNGQRAHPEHLGEDRIDRRRVVDFDIAHERGRADGDRDRDLGRASGQARDALGQAVEHRHGGGLGHCSGLLQHRRGQCGKRGGVGGGVQLGVNLRRPAVVDRRSGAEHQHWSHQRIHHRDIAVATAQQPSKTECRHGKAHGCRGSLLLMRLRAPWVKTSVIKQGAGLCLPNEFRTISRTAEDFVRCGRAFFAFRSVRIRLDRRGARRGAGE